MGDSGQTGRAMVARQIIIDLAVLAAIGVVLGFLAPLGTGYMSLPMRIAYWVVLALAGYLFYKPIGALVVRWGPKLAFPSWVMWTASVFIASIPMSILVWVVNAGGGRVRVPSLEVALTHYLAVCVVGAVVTLMFNLLPATSQNGAAVEPPAPAPLPELAPAAAPQPRFLDRLPAAVGTDLLALEMEDHYVRAHTALGNELVLMRMRDAVAELDGIAGEQVHRSWWVARGAVADVKRDGRNVRLVLDNGLEAPVSRANVSLLKERGWI
ncbi:LytTR family DNA-binding domain-containing protein [Aurantiacibacter zhengii]|nr:LytTR family DNA-binding domain-containing protein [Aurantiacibacter zhengii]